MKRKKLTLTELKVKSFVTSSEEVSKTEAHKGGNSYPNANCSGNTLCYTNYCSIDVCSAYQCETTGGIISNHLNTKPTLPVDACSPPSWNYCTTIPLDACISIPTDPRKC